MKVPEAGTEVFAVDTYDQTSASDPAFNLGYVADMGLRRLNDFASSWTMQSRLTGNGGLITNSSTFEATSNYGFWDNMVGWHQGASVTPPYSQANSYGWSFKRAPEFMDVVCYEGTGSAHTEAHNLTVAPEMIWVKNRDQADEWAVYHKDIDVDSDGLPWTDRIFLTSQAAYDAASAWNDTEPTASIFGVGTHSDVNASAESYITYLWATLAGVSKVGGYTADATLTTIDCGFAAGARFVLVRRWDATGDWYVYDSARGIVAGNDPYLLINTTAAEVTGTDYIDPIAAGFQITAAGSSTINIDTGKYIFLAIA